MNSCERSAYGRRSAAPSRRVWAAALAALLAAFAGAAARAGTVGFMMLHVPGAPDPTIAVGVWYPANGTPRPSPVGLFTQIVVPDGPASGTHLPLVVIAHGQGGDFAGHADTAYALAQAGFVAAAPTFNGDNWRDQSRALDIVGRVRQFSAVIDGLLAGWGRGIIDPARIGAFGFSAGGLTVLIAAGGEPDTTRIAPHCRAHPAFFVCRLIARQRDPSQAAPTVARFPHDGRLRAIVLAAPALGFTFDRARLAAVTVPVQLWKAADDTILPAPFSAEPVRAALPHPPDFHAVPSADHVDFLAPCSRKLASVAPQICADPTGFDRAAFHRTFNDDLVHFFQGTLG